MIDKVASRGPVRHDRVLRGFQMTLLLVTAAIIAWFTAFDLLIGFQAVAAEVDAVGVSAPLGFADIVGRVKPDRRRPR